MDVATSQLCSEKKWQEDKIERLWMQNIEAIKDKSVAENKSQNLLEKVDSLEKENEGLDRQLSEEKDTAYHNRVDVITRVGVDKAHTLFVDTYHDLGMETTPFYKSGGGGDPLPRLDARGVGVPPVYCDDLMSYASLVTCEGVADALSHEGCRHFEVFDQSNEDFDHRVFQVEDVVLKSLTEALYDRMWGPHGHGVVQERAGRVLAQVNDCSFVEGGCFLFGF